MARRKAYFVLEIADEIVTDTFNPILDRITIHLSAGKSADTAQIDLDDTGGFLILPGIGDTIRISLGWEGDDATVVFEGTIDDVDSLDDRGSGETLTISAKSADITKSKLKHRRHVHLDKSTLGDAYQKWGKDAGVKVTVHQDLASISRDYFGMHGESFLSWAARTAAEYGATFKVNGTNAALVPRGGGTAADGQAVPAITVSKGDNLISARIKPLLGRPQHKTFHAKWFDKDKAEWNAESEDADYETDAEAEHTARHPEPDKAKAGKRAHSHKTESGRDRGSGTIEMDGNAAVEPDGPLSLVGARDGVAGSYVIDSADHSYARGGGWTTTASVKQPSGSAGKDSRKASSPSTSTPASEPAAAAPAAKPIGQGGIGHA
jgi:hypothetical protein